MIGQECGCEIFVEVTVLGNGVSICVCPPFYLVSLGSLVYASHVDPPESVLIWECVVMVNVSSVLHPESVLIWECVAKVSVLACEIWL